MHFPGSSNPWSILVFALLLAGSVLIGKTWLANQAEVVSEELTTAEVISIEKKQMSYKDRTGNTITNKIGIAQLRLDDGKTFTSTVTPPYPNSGDEINVRLIHYSDGSANASALAPGY